VQYTAVHRIINRVSESAGSKKVAVHSRTYDFI